MRRSGALAAALTTALAAALALLTGCSGGDPDAAPTPSPSASASASAPASASASDSASATKTRSSAPADAATTAPYLPVPDRVALTMQGADLDLGDTATVAWEPRKQVVGALDITVRRLERARLEALSAFRLEPAQRRSSLFYVRGSVRNVGDTDLAGVGIPLYVVDGHDTLIEAQTIAATFKPCPSAPLPKPFKTGRRASFCLLYLVPEQGSLERVSFRPTQEYDPITWNGKVHQPTPPKEKPKGG